jgi:hypothetical protein
VPYIADEVKQALSDGRPPASVGQLTWVITQLMAVYFVQHGLHYHTICEVKGAVHGALDDLQERIVAPYEEKKRAENGEAWPNEILKQVRFPHRSATEADGERLAHTSDG